MFAEVAPRIFSVSHQVADGKNAVIFGERRALVIDVCLTPEEGTQVADFVREKDHQPDRVLLTHGHSDHVLGGEAFRRAEVFASIKTPAVTRDHLKGYAQNKGLAYEALLKQALAPTVMFSGELTIDLGDRQLCVFPTPGHSTDHHSIYIESERLLIAGDAVVTAIIPAIFEDSRKLEASLRLLQTLDMEVLIPGHGEVLTGTDSIQESLAWIIDYVCNVREYVRDPSVRAEDVDYDRFVGDRLPKDRFNMEDRHRTTVQKIIDEEHAERTAP
jgi:glyoxylase-like metal-dependent hydrolase (beta-lactamase superfamily II)